MASFPVYGDVDELLRRARSRKPRRRIAPVGGGSAILLSNTTISDTASIGDVVGTLSVSGGTGSETFTLSDDAGGLFSISGTSLEVAGSLTAGSDSITVQSNTGLTRSFLITVTHEVVPQPSAPVLAITSDETDDTPEFTIDIDDTISTGDTVRLQIQVAGGDWSSTVSDTTHTITSDEDGANEIDLSLTALGNDDYEARALVNDGTSDSDWSNVVSFTIAVTASNGLYVYPYLGV